MGCVYPPSWALFILNVFISLRIPPLFRLGRIFSSSAQPRRLASDLCSGVFSVTGIYFETYSHDYMHVCILMTS